MSKETALAMIPGPAPQIPLTNTGGLSEGKTSPDLAVGSIQQPSEKQVPKELDSSRFTVLAKKEAELVKQREEYKKEHEAFEKEKETLRDIQNRIKSFQELKDSDSFAALKVLGLTDTEIMNLVATSQQDNSTPEEKARKAAQTEIDKFRQEQAKREAEQLAKRNEMLVNNFKQDITKVVTSDKSKYEYINHYGAVAEDLILETVKENVEKTGELLTIKEAADMVEGYYEAEAEMLLQKEKLKAKLAALAPKEEPKAQPTTETKVAPKPSPTLSSKTVATTASTTIARKETIGEKKARLAQKLANLGKE